MTPRGSSTISDAVDLELQILATERENITELLCTKSRRTHNVVRKGWRRDFFYDEDSLIITPLNETSEEKQALLARLVKAKDVLNLSNVALGKGIGVHEKTIRRWLAGEYPSEIQIPRINNVLIRLESSVSDEVRLKLVSKTDTDSSQSEGLKDESFVPQKTNLANPIYKEIKNKGRKVAESSASNAIRDSAKREANKTTTRLKIDSAPRTNATR
jgi:hypothetical protein